MVRVCPFTTTGAGFGEVSRTCGETTGIVVITCEPCAFDVVTITPGTWELVMTMLPWAFVELMTMFATALAAGAGTAVIAWLLRPGTGRRAGEVGFAAGALAELALSFAAWFGGAPVLEFAFSGTGLDDGVLEPTLSPFEP